MGKEAQVAVTSAWALSLRANGRRPCNQRLAWADPPSAFFTEPNPMISTEARDGVFCWDCRSLEHTLHISDVHFDSKHCDREMLKRHLDEIKSCDGSVFIYGDLYDVMGCWQDPRSKGQDVRPEYLRGGEYLNLIVEDAVEFFRPYAGQIKFISEGNHESEIRRRRDVDILRWTVQALQDIGSPVKRGGYSGWNLFRFSRSNDPEIARDKQYMRHIITHFHHGYGGNAKRSKGMLDSQLATFQYPDADIVFRGHTHQKWHDPSNVKNRMDTRTKRMYTATTHYIATGSYKDGIGDGQSGWEVQKGFMPTRLGGWFVDFQRYGHTSKGIKVSITVREAT